MARLEFGQDLVGEAIELAKAPLQAGEDLAPFLISESAGDRHVEQFQRDALSDAKTRFEELVRAALGGESYALVYCGRVGQGEDAIVIERGGARAPAAEVFVQRFRPGRGFLRGFKLTGDVEPVGMGGSIR